MGCALDLLEIRNKAIEEKEKAKMQEKLKRIKDTMNWCEHELYDLLVDSAKKGDKRIQATFNEYDEKEEDFFQIVSIHRDSKTRCDHYFLSDIKLDTDTFTDYLYSHCFKYIETELSDTLPYKSGKIYEITVYVDEPLCK